MCLAAELEGDLADSCAPGEPIVDPYGRSGVPQHGIHLWVTLDRICVSRELASVEVDARHVLRRVFLREQRTKLRAALLYRGPLPGSGQSPHREASRVDKPVDAFERAGAAELFQPGPDSC